MVIEGDAAVHGVPGDKDNLAGVQEMWGKHSQWQVCLDHSGGERENWISIISIEQFARKFKRCFVNRPPNVIRLLAKWVKHPTLEVRLGV